MSMTLIKRTAEYSIFQRGDNRYAVRDAGRQAVNGDEKVRILRAEGLIERAVPAAPAEPETPEEASASSGAETPEPRAETEAEPQAQAAPQAAADDTSKDSVAQTSDAA